MFISLVACLIATGPTGLNLMDSFRAAVMFSKYFRSSQPTFLAPAKLHTWSNKRKQANKQTKKNQKTKTRKPVLWRAMEEKFSVYKGKSIEGGGRVGGGAEGASGQAGVGSTTLLVVQMI